MARPIDVAEFEELYAATARDVLAYVRRRSVGDAEDVVAEAYVVAWRRRADLPAPALRRAWLFGVARTLLKAEHRRRQGESELVGELAALPEPAHATPGPTRAASAVADALARLPANDREILRLAAWERLSSAEIAVALGIRPGTARVRLYRARRALASDPEIQALSARVSPTAEATRP